MSKYHRPLGESLRWNAHLRSILDIRSALNEDRLAWRRSLRLHEGRLLVEEEHVVQGLNARRHDVLRCPQKSTSKLIVTAVAFEPPESSRPLWRRALASDVRISMSAWRPYEPPKGRLQALGIPDDVGSNGWMAAPCNGKLVLVPSLTFLNAVAIPSASTWARLSHPLSMDLVKHTSKDDQHVVSIFRDVPWKTHLTFSVNCLPTLAFWMEEDRLRSLHRALEGFGQPGWTLSLPDRQETNNFLLNGYEDDEMVVTQRIRISHFDRFFPGTWERIQLLDHAGLVHLEVTREDGRLARLRRPQ